MNTERPTIWYSRILTSIDVMTHIDCVLTTNDQDSRLSYQRAYLEWSPDPSGNSPISLEFKRSPATIGKTMRDAFKVLNGYVVVSQAFRDVLVSFDLGSTELYEVPVFRIGGIKPSKYPPHYLLHVTETKPTLIPEESKNIRRGVRPGETEPPPNARWRRTYQPDDLAVYVSSAEGVDLWADPILQGRWFFSDRLKQAIDEAGIVSKGLDFVQARVFDR